MKMFLTTAGGVVGFTYGLLAVVILYFDAPFSLRAFLVGGTVVVGATAGYLVGFMTGSRRPEEE